MALISYWHGYRAYVTHSKGNLEKAEALYKKAFEGGCGSVKFMGTYGVLLMRTGRFEEALEFMNRALNANDVKEDLRRMIRLNRAMVYLKLGKAEKALVALEDLHENMRGSRVYQVLGYAYILAGKHQRALEYNLEALDYDDNDFVIIDNLGQSYYELGDYENAKKYFLKAYGIKSEQIDVLYHLGLVYEHEGELEGALEHFQKALLYKPDALNDATRPVLYECEARVKQKLTAAGRPIPPEAAPVKRDDMPEHLKLD